MTADPALAALVERLEQATGPDRGLDAEIALAVGAAPAGAFRPCAALDPGIFGTGPYTMWTAPDYTASLDAALTLVPADMDWLQFVSDPSGTGWEVGKFAPGLERLSFKAEGVTGGLIAIALCIASLRARAAAP